MSQRGNGGDGEEDDAELGALLDDALFAEEEEEADDGLGGAAAAAEQPRSRGGGGGSEEDEDDNHDEARGNQRSKKRQRVGVGELAPPPGSPARAAARAAVAASVPTAATTATTSRAPPPPPAPPPPTAAATKSMCPPHPAFMCGLCVVCGQPPGEDEEEGGKEGGSNNPAADDPHPHPHHPHLHPGLPLPGQDPNGSNPNTDNTNNPVALRHLHSSRALVVSAEEAKRVAERSGRALLRRKRLTLVLDLDHTLVNTVRWADLTEHEREAAVAMLEQQAEAQRAWDEQREKMKREGESGSGASTPLPPPPEHDVFSLGANGAFFAPLVTKVRPGARAMLRSLLPLYELHVYTMGDRSYADLVAALLDPDGSLLGSGGGGGGSGGVAAGGGGAAAANGNPSSSSSSSARVISAGDSSTRGSKDLDVLLVSERRALVLDDTEHVWSSRARGNVVAVPRYHFWGGSARGWDREGGRGLLERGLEKERSKGEEGKEEEEERPEQDGDKGEERKEEDDEKEESKRRARRAALVRAARSADEPEIIDIVGEQATAGAGASACASAPMAVALRVLRDAHAAFFDQARDDGQPEQQQQTSSQTFTLLPPDRVERLARDGDVRAALRDVRARALAGCRVVFSGLWPLGADPCAQPRWRLAESLGADCSSLYVAPPHPMATTHVVAAPPGQTEKARRAQQDGAARVVHPDWLAACGFLWARADERAYLLSSGYGGSRDVGHHHLHGLDDEMVGNRRAVGGGGGAGGVGGDGEEDEAERDRRAALAMAAGGGGGGGP
jgi:RNA polymerase II C-terminal domain phosphatase-like 3/4